MIIKVLHLEKHFSAGLFRLLFFFSLALPPKMTEEKKSKQARRKVSPTLLSLLPTMLQPAAVS